MITWSYISPYRSWTQKPFCPFAARDLRLFELAQ